jgi:hypothetical protein
MTATPIGLEASHPINRTPPTDTASTLGEFTVVAWRDPVVENATGAMPTASDDALVWYTPFVGTIGMVMAHRFARYAADGPSRWTIEDIAATFGLGHSPKRIVGVIGRLERWGIVRCQATTIAVRLWLPPLTLRLRRRLPDYLAAAYDAL